MQDALAVLKQYWGYEQFRPLQHEAIEAVLQGRDSVVVLPTGGGKSLCFQVPALVRPGLAVVLSPLISLMKDQVDTLIECGVPAASVNSSSSAEHRREVAFQIRSGRLKLLYLSPERLMSDRMIDFLRSVELSFIAIDEAHCISDWGHDFRPEYRMLGQLRELFPKVSLHAFTATATPRVRQDIATELGMREPAFLVGSFDRPNLVYRVQRRSDRLAQVLEIVRRRPEDSGVIYCIRRADVDELAAALAREGFRALPYHAGLSDGERAENQEAFLRDRVKIIVATVAFGMGIDKSDVRYVIHAGAPKSVEHYQQESGRGGRDGLEAECWLLYSPADMQAWRRLQSNLTGQALDAALAMLGGIDRFCSAAVCRHRALVEYFGQPFEAENCQACDVCLSEVDLVADPLPIGQKVLSSVVRQGERFGAEYTVAVLLGSSEQRILDNRHERLSTWGLLKGHDRRHVRDWIEQLLAQGFLERRGEYNVLGVTPEGRRLLRGEVTPRLLQPAAKGRQSLADRVSWEGVDRDLFEHLRSWRRGQADRRGVAPFVIFSDATLRDLARRRPSTPAGLLQTQGIGIKKLDDFGADLLEVLREWCDRTKLPQDVGIDAPGTQSKGRESRGEGARSSGSRGGAGEGRGGGGSQGSAKVRAFQLFEEGRPVAEVAATLERALSTTWEYLVEFCQSEQLQEPGPWVSDADFLRVRKAAEQVGFGKLSPIHAALEGQLDFNTIKVALICWKNAGLGQDLANTAGGNDAAASHAIRDNAALEAATPDE